MRACGPKDLLWHVGNFGIACAWHVRGIEALCGCDFYDPVSRYVHASGFKVQVDDDDGSSQTRWLVLKGTAWKRQKLEPLRKGAATERPAASTMLLPAVIWHLWPARVVPQHFMCVLDVFGKYCFGKCAARTSVFAKVGTTTTTS